MSLRPVPPGHSGGMQVVIGIARLARFDAGGMDCFVGSPEAFLTSLAPWLAITIVGAALTWLNVGAVLAARELLVAAIVLLGPPVLSHAFARFWRREENWLAYSAVFNWCQWALPAVATLWLALIKGSMAAGLPDPLAGIVAVGGILVYALALHWFVVRHGLRLSVWQAAAAVVLINLGIAGMVLLPRLAILVSELDG